MVSKTVRRLEWVKRRLSLSILLIRESKKDSSAFYHFSMLSESLLSQKTHLQNPPAFSICFSPSISFSEHAPKIPRDKKGFFQVIPASIIVPEAPPSRFQLLTTRKYGGKND
ncbi:hypothetical protein AVEN_36518-1 [Araneus ventricosus]|uniref:Uncharacterized protein n=1 Tax=Araneus ventricosus TaxID=182803 RepID=A0A4Y2H037_ARAVE|nr:hypothetical protein AVEN_36518-1 [Araneus ventricosus]